MDQIVCLRQQAMFVQTSRFPEVLAEVQQAIEVLGGTVIPKLNWSCPKVCRLNKHFSVVLQCLL